MEHRHLLPTAFLTVALSANAAAQGPTATQSGSLPEGAYDPQSAVDLASPTPEDSLSATQKGVTIAGTDKIDSALGADGHPLAGWHSGLFYLRDRSDNFRLYIQGRAQVDFYGYLGPGLADTPLKPTLFLRRVRPEVSGEIFHSWWFSIGGDFGATGTDNPKGTNETSAASPGTLPSGTSGRYSSPQTPRISAAATDVYLNYKAHGLLNIQVGQFDAPFTMENRTSDKYLPFMERSLAVRVAGIPTNKDIGAMMWGETDNRFWYYSVGLFNGDGQNRLNTDSRGDVMARTFVHPAAASKEVIKDLQVGASFHYGSRDKNYANYDYVGMSTQGNYTFWNPTYAGANGTTHVLPSGQQLGVAGELRIPVSIVDLTGEVVYINNGTREALEGYQSSNSERFGSMKGYSYYVQLGAWPFGKRDITGLPGYENMPHVDFSKPDSSNPQVALQLLAKWEQLNLSYAGASRDGTPDPKNIDGDIKVNAFSLGANLWASKHIRLSLNYVMNMFPGSAPSGTATPSQRAQAPGNTIAKGVDDDVRSNAHNLHELLARVAVAL